MKRCAMRRIRRCVATPYFGKAESLRALGQRDEALHVLAELFENPRWSLRARFRATELLLEKHDTESAANVLSRAQAQTALEKQERRYLRGRVEAELHHPERALALFETILKKSEPAHHSLVIATLFAISDVQLELKAPEAADDVLEEFIEHHDNDPDLAKVFAKLDHVYQVERKPSRTELTRWSSAPEQPRRAFAQWYLARAELRVGHRAAAIDNFRALVSTAPKRPDLLGGFLEFAQLQREDHRFDDAIAVLDSARSLHPTSRQVAELSWLDSGDSIMRRSGLKHQRENLKRSHTSTERPQETPCLTPRLVGCRSRMTRTLLRIPANYAAAPKATKRRPICFWNRASCRPRRMTPEPPTR